MNPTRSSVLFSRSSRSSRLSRLSPSALLALAAAAGCTADAATYREPSVAPRHAPRRELAPLVALADPTVAPDRGAGAVDAGDLPTTAAPDRSAAAIALLRQRGPAGLAAVLAEYDAAPASRRPALAATADAVAAQRYATASRLFWYTDLDAATSEAARTGKPILALRMLGRLDEDLSCANSRFFRTALYPDRRVSELLRERFVLLWTSERPVPRVTIDYGDGRAVMSTVTGNSVHYVLDAEGRILDALPGLYAPDVFADELGLTLALAAELGELPRVQTGPEDLAAARIDRHLEERVAAIDKSFRSVEAIWDPDARRLYARGEAASSLSRAQRATFGKGLVEVPLLHKITAGTDPGTVDPSNVALWASFGQAMFGIGDVRGEETVAATSADAARPGDRQARAVRPPAPPAAPLADVAGYRRPAYYPYLERPFGRMARHRRAVIGQRAAEKLELPAVLDDRSRQLIAALVAAEPSDASRASGASGQTEPSAPVESRKIEPLLARFEQRMLADTALNQVRLRPSILRHLRESPGLSMDALNAWVYEHVFATPRSDAWLGLRTSDEYSGLPGDGVVIGRQVARREPAATPSVSAARNGYTRRR